MPTLLEPRTMAPGDVVTETYVAHHADVVGASLRRVRDAGLAEDIAQEAFARAWTRTDLADVEACRRFVHVVARNLCIDHLRRAGRESPTDLATAGFDAVGPTDDDPAEAVVVSFEVAQARAALGDLRPRDRQLVVGRHVQERSITALAAEIAATPGSTRVILSRALGRFRDAYDRRVAAAFTPLLAWVRRVVEPLAASVAAAPAALMTIAVAATVAGAVALAPAVFGGSEPAFAASESVTSVPRMAVESSRPMAPVAPHAAGSADAPRGRGNGSRSHDDVLPETSAGVTTRDGGVVVSNRPPDDPGDATVGVTVDLLGIRQTVVVSAAHEAVTMQQCATITVSGDPSATRDCPASDEARQVDAKIG